MKIKQAVHHRNGCSGESFGVCIFRDGEKDMLGVVFHVEEDEGNPHVAVFDLNLLKQDVIAFGENSFRGDHFAADLKRELRRRWPWGDDDAPDWHRQALDREAENMLLGRA